MQDPKTEFNKYKPISDEFEFRQFPFYWLMRVANTYSSRMEKHLKKVNLNITAWRILMILKEQGPISVSDIATHAVAKTPTITKASYKLQQEELLEITTSEEDARVSMVALTNKGLETVSSVIEQTQKVFERAYENFSSDEIENLNQTLHKLYINLDNS